jgi:hypothetical protein
LGHRQLGGAEIGAISLQDKQNARGASGAGSPAEAYGDSCGTAGMQLLGVAAGGGGALLLLGSGGAPLAARRRAPPAAAAAHHRPHL